VLDASRCLGERMPDEILMTRREVTARMAKRAVVEDEAVGDPQARREQAREAERFAAARGVGFVKSADPHERVVPRATCRWQAPLYDRSVRLVVFLLVIATAGPAFADDSKLAKEDVPLQTKATFRGKNKLCCGYPLVDDQQWALRFYWLAFEADYQDPITSTAPKGGRTANEIAATANTWVELFTQDGFFFAHVPERYAWNLALEGSGMMMDGRIVNYTGPCRQGYVTAKSKDREIWFGRNRKVWMGATCFEQLDISEFPFGRGAGQRPLIPFKSVAVDPDVIQIGEPLYIPEFDGLELPDGSIHDGCVRADDTGGGIKKRKMDFFVVSYGNFRMLLEELLGVSWITPHIQAPRCQYLRDM
jgi:3D domain-containing protein